MTCNNEQVTHNTVTAVSLDLK